MELKAYDLAIETAIELEAGLGNNELRYLIVEAGFKRSKQKLAAKERTELINKGIELYEGFIKKGWEGKEQKKAERLYNRMLIIKDSLTK